MEFLANGFGRLLLFIVPTHNSEAPFYHEAVGLNVSGNHRVQSTGIASAGEDREGGHQRQSCRQPGQIIVVETELGQSRKSRDRFGNLLKAIVR